MGHYNRLWRIFIMGVHYLMDSPSVTLITLPEYSPACKNSPHNKKIMNNTNCMAFKDFGMECLCKFKKS